jgi:hypothetical protein
MQSVAGKAAAQNRIDPFCSGRGPGQFRIAIHGKMLVVTRRHEQRFAAERVPFRHLSGRF